MGVELFHADTRTDRRTDMTNPIVAFRNFESASKNVFVNYGSYLVRRAAIFRDHLKIPQLSN